MSLHSCYNTNKMVLMILIGDYYFYDSDLQLIYYLKKKPALIGRKKCPMLMDIGKIHCLMKSVVKCILEQLAFYEFDNVM